jgi:hypothetical protein
MGSPGEPLQHRHATSIVPSRNFARASHFNRRETGT